MPATSAGMTTEWGQKNRALSPGLGSLSRQANGSTRQRETCALSAAISASLRNVIAPIWLFR
jgi:hypothetical protein